MHAAIDCILINFPIIVHVNTCDLVVLPVGWVWPSFRIYTKLWSMGIDMYMLHYYGKNIINIACPNLEL